MTENTAADGEAALGNEDADGEAAIGQQQGARRRRGLRRPRTLRRQLLLVVLVIVAAVSVAVVTSTTLELHNSLLNQVDAQLSAAVSRGTHGSVPGGGDDAGASGNITPPAESEVLPPPFLDAQGQGAGTVGVIIRDGAVTQSGRIEDNGRVMVLTGAQQDALAAVSGDDGPQTVSVPGLGRFRAASGDALSPDGATSEVVVIGLPMAPLESTVERFAIVAAAVALLGLVIAILGGRVLIRRTLAPLQRVAATAQRVSALPLDRGAVDLAERVPEELTDEKTEVGQVGSAVNRMLGHVGDALAARHESEQEVRTFVADAGHELRTPLAAIRGYAELVRRRPEPVPDDVREAMARVESETRRMTRLVSDMLLLARLDAGRELQIEDVDLSAAVVTAILDAHAAGPDHQWELDLPEDAIVVRADPDGLYQVLANLCANARVHTPPGTRVDVAVRELADGAEVTVTDNGPGVSEGVRGRLFERFSRGDASRSGVSTGLGLAIVRAMVTGFDGTIGYEDAPGGGARFVIRLPLAKGNPPT